MKLKGVEPDSDLASLLKGDITVTPMLLDPTAWEEKERVKELIINGLTKN